MKIEEMESIIETYGHPLQSVLHAALVIKEFVTIGGASGRKGGGGMSSDPARVLDVALSITKHLPDDTLPFYNWIKTHDPDPRRFPKLVWKFWSVVPIAATADMAKIVDEFI